MNAFSFPARHKTLFGHVPFTSYTRTQGTLYPLPWLDAQGLPYKTLMTFGKNSVVGFRKRLLAFG